MNFIIESSIKSKNEKNADVDPKNPSAVFSRDYLGWGYEKRLLIYQLSYPDYFPCGININSIFTSPIDYRLTLSTIILRLSAQLFAPRIPFGSINRHVGWRFEFSSPSSQQFVFCHLKRMIKSFFMDNFRGMSILSSTSHPFMLWMNLVIYNAFGRPDNEIIRYLSDPEQPGSLASTFGKTLS